MWCIYEPICAPAQIINKAPIQHSLIEVSIKDHCDTNSTSHRRFIFPELTVRLYPCRFGFSCWNVWEVKRRVESVINRLYGTRGNGLRNTTNYFGVPLTASDLDVCMDFKIQIENDCFEINQRLLVFIMLIGTEFTEPFKLINHQENHMKIVILDTLFLRVDTNIFVMDCESVFSWKYWDTLSNSRLSVNAVET